MKYCLLKNTLSAPPPIDISEQRYRDISEATSGLFEALHIEEKFDVLIENYTEFEVELARAAAVFRRYVTTEVIKPIE